MADAVWVVANAFPPYGPAVTTVDGRKLAVVFRDEQSAIHECMPPYTFIETTLEVVESKLKKFGMDGWTWWEATG